MDISTMTPLASVIADRLRAAREDITTRWLERIVARVALSPNRVFPTEELLDHVPLLIDRIADFVENPADEVAAQSDVVDKARELGAMRHRQGFSAHEILKEHELLGSILFSFLTRAVDEIEIPSTRSEVLICTHRLYRAIEVIRQTTTAHFLDLMAARVREREDRLGTFNRMVAHQLKDRLGAVLGAYAMLKEAWLDEGERERFITMVGENAVGIRAVLDDLETLSKMDEGRRQQRNVLLAAAAAEASRQLREFARSRGVSLRIAGDLPNVEVNAAAVELCLTNYLSNAIKYSNEASPDRWVELRATLANGAVPDGECEIVVEVRDNGRGVDPTQRARLFERFFRAPENVNEVEGTGLGLSIVRETVESLGGRAWAEFPDEGSRFLFSLPCRRAADRES